MKGGQETIIIRIDSERKKEFASVCSQLGYTMTTVITASIDKFIKETKQKK